MCHYHSHEIFSLLNYQNSSARFFFFFHGVSPTHSPFSFLIVSQFRPTNSPFQLFLSAPSSQLRQPLFLHRSPAFSHFRLAVSFTLLLGTTFMEMDDNEVDLANTSYPEEWIPTCSNELKPVIGKMVRVPETADGYMQKPVFGEFFQLSLDADKEINMTVIIIITVIAGTALVLACAYIMRRMISYKHGK
ncbi:hypothetical protein P8452_59650 [Trifolium repens]|nr:hypothetical protein P8452_59650 [Trifolium repens]